ncbi:MAG TPA: thioredoxin domain-containing protein, partial [Pirellulales bacterium]|nr:thioredoxin domain-containing protein [Pirellulales bacterium]
LAAQSSPYLLQHAHNPVDWYPWGPEALERSKRENKPIFLSIGYSACHWCHVMEHESFEDAQIARFLNDHFVPIKVDREERPDLDQIYMNAVQLMTGRGGWPMSVFLTPDLKPFYGGTYWPPAARTGMPGFNQVLSAVAEAWEHRRDMAIEQADSLTEHLQALAAPQLASSELSPALLETAAASLQRAFDPTYGGFGGAPKFPHPMDLRLLLRWWHRHRGEAHLSMVTATLDKMAAGGIYDQLGGGFHRYSVDERWLVPHFEKMLYDNALLVPCYVEAFLVTGNEDYARVARETCEYVLREMTDPDGGFYSTQDADSEGEEGKFFVWTPEMAAAVIGAEAAKAFDYVYDVTPEGNFEHGRSILNRPKTLDQCARILGRDARELERELQVSRAQLLAAREKRVHPGLDDKVLVSWNGMMIEALAVAAGALDEPRYLAAAERAADFILRSMRRPDGRLLHSWRRGEAKLDAYLDDYSCLAGALVSLYEADFDERWIDEALGLSEALINQFADRQHGGFFFTAADHEALIARQKDLYDAAVPSGNSMAACALLRLAKLTGRGELLSAAEDTLRFAAGLMHQSPGATGQMLLALDLYLGPTPEIVVIGDPNAGQTATALAALRHRFVPNKLVACRSPARLAEGSSALAPVFAGKRLDGPEPGVFICKDFACQAPLFGHERAIAAWDVLAGVQQSSKGVKTT